MKAVVLEEIDIDSNKNKCNTTQEKSIGKANPQLLYSQAELLTGRQILIHQNPDGHSQRLGTYISCHVKDQGLEADHDGEHGNYPLKNAHHGRYDQS